jgi:hypothetical protein
MSTAKRAGFAWPVYAAIWILFAGRLVYFIVDGYERDGIGGAIGWVLALVVFTALCLSLGRLRRARR